MWRPGSNFLRMRLLNRSWYDEDKSTDLIRIPVANNAVSLCPHKWLKLSWHRRKKMAWPEGTVSQRVRCTSSVGRPWGVGRIGSRPWCYAREGRTNPGVRRMLKTCSITITCRPWLEWSSVNRMKWGSNGLQYAPLDSSRIPNDRKCGEEVRQELLAADIQMKA